MSATYADRAKVAERRAEVMRLRAAGMPFREIAQRTGHPSASAAVQDLTRAMAAARVVLDEQLPSYAALELERLDGIERTLQVTLGVAVQAQDWDLVLRSADRLTRLSAARRELLGLNMGPVKPADRDAAVDEIDELAEARRTRRGKRVAGKPR